jgi:hypothetical protein
MDGQPANKHNSPSYDQRQLGRRRKLESGRSSRRRRLCSDRHGRFVPVDADNHRYWVRSKSVHDGVTTLAGTFVVTGDLSAFAVRSGASLISELGSLNLNSGSLTVGGLLTAGTGVSVWTMARRSKQRTSLYKRQV